MSRDRKRLTASNAPAAFTAIAVVADLAALTLVLALALASLSATAVAAESSPPAFEEPVPLLEIASPAHDKAPSLSCDERCLFFDSNRAGAAFDAAETWRHGPRRVDVYEARRSDRDAKFEEPRLVLVDARAPEISADGLELFFLREVPSAGTGRPDCDLFVTRREDRHAPFAGPRRIDELASPWLDAAPSLTADGRTLYFHSERPGGRGKSDLWVAVRRDAGAPFGPPRNLAELNTEHQDHTPSITGDGTTLYFASDRPGSAGSIDLWVTRLDPDTGRFGTPHPLGGPINTEHKEKAPEISCDGKRLYFRSTRPGGKGASDLWMAERRGNRSEIGVLGSASVLGRRDGAAERSVHRADLPDVGIRWETDLESAMARAEKEDKPLFLSFNARRFGSPSEEFF